MRTAVRSPLSERGRAATFQAPVTNASGDRSPRSAVRAGAAQVNQLEADGDVSGLIDALQSDVGHGKYGQIRSWAARAVGNLGDPRAVPDLIELLNDHSEVVRNSAARALGRIGDHRAEPALEAALRDTSEAVRASAANALGALGSAESVGALSTAAASDPATFVRINALEALDVLGLDAASDMAAAELHRLAWWQRAERKRLQALLAARTGERPA